MASTVLFQNTRRFLFGFQSWLCPIALSFSLLIHTSKPRLTTA